MPRRVARDALLVIGGRIGFVGLWFVAVLLVYRGLGADEAGLAEAGRFAVAIACVKIASGCIVDPGDVALMRRAPTLLRSDAEAAHRLLRAAFLLRLVATLVVAAALLAFAAGFGRRLVGGGGAVAPLMGLIVAAILADMLFRSVLVVLQAAERFPALVLLEGALQVSRLLAILLLLAAGAMTVERVLVAYAGAGFLAGLAGAALLLPRALFASAGIDRADVRDLVGFLKWMVPAMVLAAFNERLDILLVYAFKGADAAGRYGAMLTLAVVPDLVAGCLAAIVQPRIARMLAEGSYGETLRRFLTVALPGAVLCFLVALLAGPTVIPLVLGAGYAPGVPAFLWLLAGTLFWLAVTPLPMSLVAVHAPARIALVTIGQTAIIVTGAVALLPPFGPVGMAQAVCAMRVGVALALLVMAHRMARPPRAVPLPTGEGPWASTGR
ncbi:lipopolysaccharide biosynthesis protein [Neoroseomonas soli]|uniref:Polysaccharide biosynthesis protein n=1 Tax=Neoroseomonas soli TaxID=1081025 RepID=A0A9X9WUV7_9PROT|nr:hypothetical protein [Neoroseomonas soli]MBR0670936.1 hypothetical protein [Neoroseomonas soli]